MECSLIQSIRNPSATPDRVHMSMQNSKGREIRSHRVPSANAKTARNTEIVARSQAGESVVSLALAFTLSRIRIQQILDHSSRMLATQKAIKPTCLKIDATTELRTLPISFRLERACEIRGVKTVADLSRQVDEIGRMPTVGRRTMLEISELLDEAGLAQNATSEDRIG
jgi:hypothetical protein